MLIDVRTQEEYITGHASNSVHIPLDILAEEVVRQNIPKETPIAVCCESGGRSSYACMILEQLGFTRVTNAGSWRNI